MYLDNLAAFIYRLRHGCGYTYESASERCGISSRYLGSIGRMKSVPTIRTLEKLCVGFGLTPDTLLLPSDPGLLDSYRLPMDVTHVRRTYLADGIFNIPVCPRCNGAVERDFQQFCDCCGQLLNWRRYPQAVICIPPADK